MDDLQNYVGLSNAVNESNEAYKEKVAGLSDIAREKIKELTDPIGEGFMIEGAKGALTKGVDNFAKSLRQQGIISDEASELISEYRKNGTKGVIKHLIKKSRAKAQDTAGSEAEQEGQQVAEQEISDLSPEEFNATQQTISNALKARFSEFSQAKQNSIARKYQNEKIGPDEEDDLILRRQQNAQKFSDIMDEQEQRQQLLGDENPLKQTILNNADDDVLNETQKSISGSVKLLNNSLEKQASDLAEKVAKKDALKTAEKTATEEVGETELESGGPEDVLGDIVSGIIGAGVFLGGVFGAKHIKEHSPAQNIANISFQAGA